MKIKLLCCDVDGTMTDGAIYLDANGIEQKRFCCRDGAGFHRLKMLFPEILIAMITSEISGVNYKRYLKFEKLKTTNFFHGGAHGVMKLEAVQEIAGESNIDISQIAYIGDDTNDLEAMKSIAENEGYLFCPKNADHEIKNLVSAYSKVNRRGYVLGAIGGHGAVRECCEIIIVLNEAI